MNYYFMHGKKFWCLNPINENCSYSYDRKKGVDFLYTYDDDNDFMNLLHRTDGPAIEGNDYAEWFDHGKLHRLDGPAIEYISGIKQWFYYGEPIHCKDNEEFLKIISMKAFL